MTNLRRAASTIAIGWAVLGVHAFAQEAAPAQTQEDAPERAIETIVITGEKVDQDLQKTVSSVAVVGGEQIETEGLTSIADAFNYIANVNMGNTGGGFSIRGIPFDNLLGAGSAPLAQIYVDDATMGDQATRFNADQMWDIAQIEVLRGAQSTVQGRNALAGAVVIRTQDPTYEWTGKARVLGETFDNGTAYTASVAGGGPIIDDVLAFRIAAERAENDGYTTNPVRGLDQADFNDHSQIRAKLLFEPTSRIRSLFTFAYSDAWVAHGVSDRRTRDANGFTNIDDIVPGRESLRQSQENVPDYNQSTLYDYVLRTDWEATDALTFTMINSYSRELIQEKIDTDSANLDPSIFPQDPFEIPNPYNIPHVRSGLYTFEPAGTQYEDVRIKTEEITASWDNGGKFRGLAGAYYAGSQEREYNFTPGLQLGLHDIVDGATRSSVEGGLVANLGPLRGIPAPGNPVAGIPAGPEGDAAFNAFVNGATDLIEGAIKGNYSDIGAFLAMTSEPLDVENFALYARGEYDITDKLTVGLGVRYDNERQTEGLILSGDPLGMPNPAAPTLPAGFPAAFIPFVQASLAGVNAAFDDNLLEAETESKQRFEAVLPSGFIRYNFDEDRSLAFSMRRGYRAGGADLNIVRQFVSTFDPEYTTNYELAFRSYWFNHALRLNGNVFYTDWTDQQLVVSLSTLQQDEIGFNVGKSNLQGFEVEAMWDLTDDLSVQGVLGHTKTEFEDFDSALAEAVISAQKLTAPINLEETLAAFSGKAFGFAPEWTGAVRFIYDNHNGLFGTLGVTYEGESYVNNSNRTSPTFLNNDARALVNLTVGYDFGNYVVSFIGHNLTDEEYVASGGNERVRLGAPRVLGVQLQTKF